MVNKQSYFQYSRVEALCLAKRRGVDFISGAKIYEETRSEKAFRKKKQQCPLKNYFTVTWNIFYVTVLVTQYFFIADRKFQQSIN